jgi:hypothetical protein
MHLLFSYLFCKKKIFETAKFAVQHVKFSLMCKYILTLTILLLCLITLMVDLKVSSVLN